MKEPNEPNMNPLAWWGLLGLLYGVSMLVVWVAVIHKVQ
jgi:hypothetical protein